MGARSNPVRSARRKAELQERLGSEHPFCSYCGYSVAAALIRVRRKPFDKHHHEGKNHDSDPTILVCRNCHGLRHEELLDAGVELGATADPIKRVAMMLRAEAVHFEALAQTKRKQADLLEQQRS